MNTKPTLNTRVSYPDPYWIRIQSNLDVLYGGLEIVVFDKFIKTIFFSAVNFLAFFGHQNRGSGSVSNKYGSDTLHNTGNLADLVAEADDRYNEEDIQYVVRPGFDDTRRVVAT
jgi:hypothetical protein